MIDAGANLTHRDFLRDRDVVIEYARDHTPKLEGIIVIGTSFSREQTQIASTLCKKYPGFCWRTIGVHPHNAERELTRLHAQNQRSDPGQKLSKMVERTIQEVDRTGRDAVVAIGETGLDYARTFSFHEDQKLVMKAHLRAARHLKLPVYLHERDAFDDFISVLDVDADENDGTYVSGVVHCFNGGEKEAAAYISRGLYLSFSGTICMPSRSTATRALVTSGFVPLDRVLVDSDAPYLLPRSANGLVVRPPRNEPCTLGAIVDTLARLMDVSPEEVALATSDNAKHLFALARKNEDKSSGLQ
jgi:TatD DNase family protein